MFADLARRAKCILAIAKVIDPDNSLVPLTANDRKMRKIKRDHILWMHPNLAFIMIWRLCWKQSCRLVSRYIEFIVTATCTVLLHELYFTFESWLSWFRGQIPLFALLVGATWILFGFLLFRRSPFYVAAVCGLVLAYVYTSAAWILTMLIVIAWGTGVFIKCKLPTRCVVRDSNSGHQQAAVATR